MAHSMAQHDQVQCPHCGHVFDADVWLIVDADERPDLLARLRAGNLHSLLCPNCGQLAGDVDAPILVYRPGQVPRLLLSPAADTTSEQDQAHARQLVDALREQLGAEWQDEWLTHGLAGVERMMLPVALAEDPEAALRRMQEEAQRALTELRERDPEAFEHLEQEAQRQAEIAPLLQAIEQMLGAETWPETLKAVEAHPEVLSKPALDLLADLEQRAREQGDTDGARMLAEHLALLRRCREMGTREAFAEKMEVTTDELQTLDALSQIPPGVRDVLTELAADGAVIRSPEDLERALEGRPELRARLEAALGGSSATLDVPEGVEAILRELAQPSTAMDMPRRIELCQQALGQVERHQQSTLWAALQVDLGNSLAQNPRGRRPDNLEQAIDAYQQALTVFSREAIPIAWAQTMSNLGNAYADRIVGARVDNLEQAIDAYQQALTVRTREAMPVDWAQTMSNLGSAYADRIVGARADNLEQAIDAYQQALTVRTREAMPVDWAQTMSNLGNAYRSRIQGNRADNLELAIDSFTQALTVRTREALPIEWAQTMSNLGNAYADRIVGAHIDNLEQAIDAYQQALTVFTREALPIDWAQTMSNLGSAYRSRIQGNRADNLEQAIDAFQQALTVFTREAMPVDWAQTMSNLGSAYRSRIRGNRADNLEQAIDAFQQALTVFTRRPMPTEWATTIQNLGNAYRSRIRGNRADNLEQAIDAYQQALTVRTREAMPTEWAITMQNLGSAYWNRVRGNRADNLELAIDSFTQALTVFTREALPIDWAQTMSNLGSAYADRIRGERVDNLEQAIDAYQQALTVFTREALPTEWAQTMSNLGSAYWHRIRGNRADNLEQAIDAFQQALTVFTREAMPTEWGITMQNLGNAYRSRIRGNRADNLEQAIDACQQALTVRTREAMPIDWAQTMSNLGTAYGDRIRGNRADNLELAIDSFTQALTVFTREALPIEWAQTMSNLGFAYTDRVRGNRADNQEQGIDAYQQALTMMRPETLPDDARRAARNLGNALSLARRWQEAAAAYKAALAAAEVLYRAGVTRSGREAELADSADLPRRAAYALARAERTLDAALTLEQGRARGLGEALARDRADLQSLAAKHPAAHASFVEVVARQRRLEAAERDIRGDTEQARALFRQLSREAEDALRAMDAALNRIRALPGYENFLAPPSPYELALAAETSPLVYLVTAPYGSLALLVEARAASTEPEVTAIWADGFNADDLDTLLVKQDGEEVVSGYLPAQLGFTTGLDQALAEMLPKLGQDLMARVAEALRDQGANSVVLVPCGPLGLLPLQAAQYAVDGQPRRFQDEFAVTYAPSARSHLEAQRALARHSDAPPVLAGVGNPLPHPRPLPFSHAELDEIQKLFPQQDRRTLYGEQATKGELLKALPGATYVHLACHGRFDPGEPLNSQVQLADGAALTLREMVDQAQLSDARLAVLSACQSGITEFQRLPDEAIGLPAGLLQAGAAGVVGTLWSVNDLSTALLMIKFYEYHLRGDASRGQGPLAPARALQQAARWLREVSAGELLAYFEQHKALAEAEEAALAEATKQPTGRMPYEVSVKASWRFRLMDPSDKPFQSPYHWAPFIFLGV